MIQIQNLEKFFGEQLVLKNASFIVGKGERVGIAGRNGCGKSTLLRMILGQEDYDGGHIDIPRNYTIGYLEQHIQFSHATVLEEACSALPLNEDGWLETYKAEAILQGLGMNRAMLESAPDILSGGYQVRLNLAKALLAEPHLLLLDEPTNYLDIISVRWLERFLKQWPGELLLITHDRDFMNRVCTHTLGIHRHQVRKVQGSVEKWQELILDEEELYMRTIANEQKKREQAEAFINRFRAQANRAKAVQSRVKALEKQGKSEELAHIKNLDFRFHEKEFTGKKMLDIQGLSFGYSSDTLLIDDLSSVIYPGDRIGVIGANGKGKSTLLRLLAGELEAIKGEIKANPQLEIAYFGQSNIERLKPELSIEDEILSALPEPLVTRARSLAGLMMFSGDMALKKTKVLSGGEKSRVMLAKILAQPANLLLLDEPTNHLDMESIDSLVDAVDDFGGGLLLVSHSEQMLHALCNRLLIFDAGNVRMFEGSYAEFLRSVGWQDEKKNASANKDEASEKAVSEENTDKAVEAAPQLSRRERAELVQERNRILKPLKKSQEKLEKEIETLDIKHSEIQELLVNASTSGNADEIQTLSQTLAEIEKKQENAWLEYDQATEALEKAELSFALE